MKSSQDSFSLLMITMVPPIPAGSILLGKKGFHQFVKGKQEFGNT